MRRVGLFLSLLVLAMSGVGSCRRARLPEAIVETNVGTFVITLYSEDAPNTVKNFIGLARQDFYNGTIFFKVSKGNIIQGGDPLNSGNGGPGYIIAMEPNDRENVRGAVGMIHGHDVNTAGSQFYICLRPLHEYDGYYTVFGRVTKGMNVVKKIGDLPVDANFRPEKMAYIVKITIEQ